MKAAREFVSDMVEHVNMPDVYVAIRQLLLNPKTTIEDFVDVVERDSMLTVRVMRMAKSQYFGFPRSCESLYQAISLIGLMQLHDLLLGMLCMRTFSAIPEEVFNLRSFWRYNVQCGIAARTIGQYSKSETHHVFFTLGLLHEVGHAALFLKAPEVSLQALEEAESGQRSLAEVDYGEVGAELMQAWHLPPSYQQVAAFHLDPEAADAEYRPAVWVVSLAHRLCQNSQPEQKQQLIESCIEAIPEFSRLPQNIDELISNEVDTHTDAVLGLLWPCGSQALGPKTEFRLDA